MSTLSTIAAGAFLLQTSPAIFALPIFGLIGVCLTNVQRGATFMMTNKRL